MTAIVGRIRIREASYKWGVSERRVNQYCTQVHVTGLPRFGRSWAIPADPRREKGTGGGDYGKR